MHIIETISNNKIKEIVKLHQKKYRDEKGLFIAEGGKILEEITQEHICAVDIIVLKGKKINCNTQNIIYAEENIMKKLATTSGQCEVIVVAKKRTYDKNLFKQFRKIALFEEIKDPGNLGTIIRSASAFGIEGIILLGDCVDLYSSKVIRSAAGNFFKIPIIEISSQKEIISLLPEHKFISTAIMKENTIDIKECAKLDKFVIMFGSEANGLNKEIIKIADKNIRLNMKNNVESLNLSVSASIIFYEIFTNL